MSEKPGKRVVNKREYVALMMRRMVLMNALIPASLLLGLGVAGFCGVILMTMAGLQDWRDGLVNASLFACMATASYLFARYIYKQESKVERVALLGKHTALLLLEGETLLRASDLPPFHQQAELLRSAEYGKETPAEELLRASTTGGQDKDAE